MSDMVERLTVILGEQLASACQSGRPIVLSKIARALLENMREPTADMIDAGRDIGPDAPYGVSETDARWQAMIDAELK